MRRIILLLLFSFICVSAYAVDYTASPNCFGAYLMEVDEDPLSDSSGEGHTGALTAANNPDFQTGNAPAAYSTNYYDFDGANDHVIIGDIDEIEAGDISFVAWVYHESINTNDNIYTKMAGAATDGILYWRDDVGTVRDDCYVIFIADSTDTSSMRYETDTNSSVQDTWTHVAFTFTPSTGKLYVDGVLDLNAATASSAIGGIDAGAQDAWIGENDSGADDFDGDIDEVAVFNDILSLAEINDIMDNGLEGAAPPSGNPQMIMIIGG